MSAFGDNEWDDILWEIREFLKNHKISELMEIIRYAIEEKEEGYLN